MACNNIRGFLPTRIMTFLLNLHISRSPFYFTRHGQSEYNEYGQIGGDSGLTERGEEYATALGKWVSENISCPNGTPRPAWVGLGWGRGGAEGESEGEGEGEREGEGEGEPWPSPKFQPHSQPHAGVPQPARLWTSTMRRTVQTARHIAHQRLEGPGGVEWINMRPKAFKNLDEIYAGVCDGMMYEEVAQTYPEEVRGWLVVLGRSSTYLLCSLCTLCSLC
jgi:hypothetical protein